MVPLDRVLVSSYRLSIVTMSLSAAIWLQFAMQSVRLHPCSWQRFLTYLLSTKSELEEHSQLRPTEDGAHLGGSRDGSF